MIINFGEFHTTIENEFKPMKTNKYIPALLICCSLLLISSFTETDSLFIRYLRKALTAFNLQNPAEKIYLHTDKTFYKPGDDIWFCAYLQDGTTLKASETSSIVYVELIDPKGSVMEKRMLEAKGGKSPGQFLLPEEAPGGLYKLKAYTKWMLNFGEKMIFEKKLQVQKIITPNLLSTLDFEREAYGAGDTVTATLELRDLENNPLTNKQLTYTVRIHGKQHTKDIASTNTEGHATIRFVLPENLNTADGVLNVAFQHKGHNESVSRAIPIVLNKIEVQFFPEGGNAVETFPCLMAFKALNEFGKPADVEGEIINSKGRVITTFKSYHQGMGAFRFVPVSNQTYRARILKPQGISRLYPLTGIKSEGSMLHLKERTDNTFLFSIYSNVSETIHMVVQMRGKILYDDTFNLKKGENKQTVSIIQENLCGVAQVTLFDDFENPIAERLLFLFPENDLKIDISTNKSSYAPREKVKMDIEVSDNNGNPVEGNFSLAVVNDKIITFADDKQDNILSSLLLSSDVKGEIYEPSFYFDKTEPKATQALDYLLLTQGWRRFAWSEVLHPKVKQLENPEHHDKILGQVVNSRGQGVKARVVVIDDANKKIAKLTTTDGGRFSVTNISSFRYLQIYAKALDRKSKKIKIRLNTYSQGNKAQGNMSRLDHRSIKVNPLLVETKKVANSLSMQPEDETSNIPAPAVIEELEIIEDDEDFEYTEIEMSEDDVELDEVITIAYGVSQRSQLTGSVTTVQSNDIFQNNMNVSDALQGRVAGLMVQNNTGQAGGSPSVMIRGTASLSNSNPLYIVDGIPVTDVNNIDPNTVERIDVLKNAVGTAVYGIRGANGVISITTKKGYSLYYRPRKYSRRVAFNKLYNSRVFLPVKEFYIPPYERKDTVIAAIDNRETIYWNPEVVTNKKGKATVEFYNSDEVTTFRTIVEGVGKNGQVGRSEFFHHVMKPLSVEAKIPPYLVFEDRVKIPVVITNNTKGTIEGTLKLNIPQSWELTTAPPTNIKVLPGGYYELLVQAKVGAAVGRDSVKISFGNNEYQDVYAGQTEVVSKGFPAEMSFSSRALHSKFSFDLSNTVTNSTKARISVYNDVLAEVMDGIESVLREPHGCFEQASASTYPNVLILKYLEENKKADEGVRKKALKYIHSGYKQLTAFETEQGGFEWFGHTPPHEGLTAFGLMEFHDMSKVYNGVDQEMLKRTKDWLLSRKDGKGGFHINKGKYGFSGASKEVTNAYLVYAFSEVALNPAAYQLEYEQACRKAVKSKDAYRIALMANACLNRKDTTQARAFIDFIVKKVNRSGVKKLEADHSIVRSYGNSLTVEVAALSAMALMKTDNGYFDTVVKLMDYIIGARRFGGYGSTQATVLSLKALTQYAQIINRFSEDGKLVLKINNREVLEKEIRSKDKLVVIDSLEQYLTKGVQTFEVDMKGFNNPVSFSANVEWKKTIPASSRTCKVRIQTNLANNSCKVGELVRLSTRLVNITNQGIPMTVAQVGLPSGLAPQPWQLKKMQEEHEFDYYEIHKNYVVFYFTELEPNARRIINLDLKAEVPGIYESPASSTYLYYTNELKDWHAGEQVTIEQP
ncbi:hypothetical protein DMA11_19020 [Marinilabiliaceae bacterium JC017]|nr:hypothetical protein DMA11_19020 [Marinilabiliaceae bacterium JC017]